MNVYFANREMCLWDLVDGKCREVTKLPYVHTNIQSYQMSGSEDVKLFCNGYYAEIFIMDPFSLEIVCSLSSREKSDWISALYVLRPAKRKGIRIRPKRIASFIKYFNYF